MLHYTWGSIFTLPANKSEVWKFDKRFYTDASIQINARPSQLLRWAALRLAVPVCQSPAPS